MTDEERVRVAMRWFEALNGGDIDALDEVVDEGVVDHSGMSTALGGGRRGHKRLVRMLRTMIPDWESRIDEVNVRDDLVTIRHSGGGTAPGPTRLLPGVGNGGRMRFQMVSTVRISRGKIVEHWAKSRPD